MATVLERRQDRLDDVERRIAHVEAQVERMGFRSTAAHLVLTDLQRERDDVLRSIREFELEYIADAEGER